MTVEERMRMIDQKVKKDEEEEFVKLQKYESEYEECIRKIKALRERITDLLKVANYAMDNGISLKYRDVLHGDYDNGDFFSNFWSHRLGLKDNEHLGYTKGGACGNIDFYTNGDDIYGYDTKKRERVSPLFDDMKRFINGFDKFEQKFYEYIDKQCK